LEPALAGHLQIDDRELGGFAGRERDRAVVVVCGSHVVAAVDERAGEPIAIGLVVIDDQDRRLVVAGHTPVGYHLGGDRFTRSESPVRAARHRSAGRPGPRSPPPRWTGCAGSPRRPRPRPAPGTARAPYRDPAPWS